jgi:macrolide-specific efflux system membrane fusion protein
MKRLRMLCIHLAALLVLAVTVGDVDAGDYDAVLDWAGIYVVNFPLDGGVTHVHVRPGDRVGKGAKLVELNPVPLDIRIKRFKAEVAASQPVLADAKRDFEHAQSLYEQTVLSDVELQRARHAYEKASAELAASRAQLEFALWRKGMASAAAPWDAWVVERNVEPGQMLVAEQRSKPLLVLAKAGVMAASTVLPLSSVKALQSGQAATVLIGDQQYAGNVVSLGMAAEAGTKQGSYRVVVEFEVAAKDVYRAGQAATIRLP